MMNLNVGIISICIFTGLNFLSVAAFGQNLSERLGYSSDAKLLIIHADDLGVTHSENSASINAYEKGGINSASIMVPTPWFPEIAAYARENPDFDLGLHLTLTAEWEHLKWGGVMPSNQIPSLINNEGYFYQTSEDVAQNADIDEVEKELRAQIERAIDFGIKPTHLDSHMGSLFTRPDLFEVYVSLGEEYKIPVLAGKSWLPDGLFSEEYPALVEQIIMLNPEVPAEQWQEAYDKAIQDLGPGLNELIIHLAYDNEEMQATTIGHEHGFESAWRQRDYDYVTSPEFQEKLRENSIQAVTWREIQQVMYPDES